MSFYHVADGVFLSFAEPGIGDTGTDAEEIKGSYFVIAHFCRLRLFGCVNHNIAG